MSAAVPVRPVPAAERGALRIADRVVAKIAAQAAGEALTDAPGADLVPRGAAPRATVTLRRRAARLRLSVELGYPVDIGAACRTVRGHVTERVEALTGIDVRHVVVEVERLHSAVVRAAEEGRVQ
jgi:uncharacterized alkaline shock family protein YloU